MFFSRSKTKTSRDKAYPLKPFLLRVKDGHLLGLAMDPQVGAPCVGCVARWLERRQVWAEPAELSELRSRRELIAELLAENSAHVFYEIGQDGNATRLEGAVFPHPECNCRRSQYVAPEMWSKKTNFAFSPIYSLRCSRFSTPEGNLWLAQAAGDGPCGGEITGGGVGPDRETARFTAVDKWLLRAGLASVQSRALSGESLTAETLQTGVNAILPPAQAHRFEASGLGAGGSRDEAILDALNGLARTRTLRSFAAAMKSPMMVVGANNWLRGKVPFFLLQEYDLHPLFYPNAMPAWVAGVAAVSRKSTHEKPLFAFGSHSRIGAAMDMAIGRILELVHPPETRFSAIAAPEEVEEKRPSSMSKLNMWWTHWLYRCPKIGLKDVLHLEDHRPELTNWREFFRDGIEPVSILSLNGERFPTGLRHLVALSEPEEARTHVRNVNGVGSLTAFRDSLQ